MSKNRLHLRKENLEFTTPNGISISIPIDKVAGIMPSAMRPARSLIFDIDGSTYQAMQNKDDLELCLIIQYQRATTFTPFEVH